MRTSALAAVLVLLALLSSCTKAPNGEYRELDESIANLRRDCIWDFHSDGTVVKNCHILMLGEEFRQSASGTFTTSGKETTATFMNKGEADSYLFRREDNGDLIWNGTNRLRKQ